MAVTQFGTPTMERATSGSVTGSWGSGQNRVAGNVLVAAVSAGAGTSATAIATSTTGWSLAATVGNASTANAQVAFFTATAAGADSAPTFTSTLSGTGAMTCTLFELAGADCLVTMDTNGTYASGGSAGTLSSMEVSTAAKVAVAGEFAITVFAQEASAATNTWNGGGSWTNAANDGATSSVLHTAVDYQASPTVSATLSETGHWTTDTSAFGAAAILVVSPWMGGFEEYADYAYTTAGGSDGTTSPAAGTVEVWGSTSFSGFPVASQSAMPPTYFCIADSADAPSELITVINSSTGTVIRGAQGTAPVAHDSGATFFQVVSPKGLEQASRTDWVNALTTFSADPTGDSDSWLAIQNALLSFGTLYQATQGKGGVVYLPEGGYLVSKPLIIPSSVRLQGAGENSTIITLITGSNCDVIQWATYESTAQAAILGVADTAIGNAFYASVCDLTVHGDSFHTTVPGYHHGINITTNPASGASTAPTDPETDPHPYICNVTIEACTGDGLYHSGRGAALYQHVWSEYQNGNGFTLSYDTTLVACNAYECNMTGFYSNFGSVNAMACEAANCGTNSATNSGTLWVSGQSYTPGWPVIYDSAYYVCIESVSGSTAPSSDGTHWQAVTATSPQWWGVGFMWDSGVVEHAWTSCNAQENANSNFYLHDCDSVSLTGTSNRPNYNAGSNAGGNATVVFDDCSGCFVQLTSSNLSSDEGYVTAFLNGAGQNTLIVNTDGTEHGFYAPSSVVAPVGGNQVIANGSYGIIPVEQWAALTSTYTLAATTTALQQLLNATTAGAVAVAASTTYFFECEFDLSAMSTTSGTFSFGFGGTAGISSVKYTALADKQTSPATENTGLITTVSTASATALVASNTTAAGAAFIRGIIRINSTGGTLIPQVAVSVEKAAIVGVNSYFRIWPAGSNTVTNVGNWS